MDAQRFRISLAAPAYNEAEGIVAVVEAWIAHLRGHPRIEAFEIVICNDGSKDNTGPVLDSLAAKHPEMRPVHFAVNQGAAAALANAIRNTQLDWVLLIDSDGQFPIENVDPAMEAVQQSGARAVIGVRERKADSLAARFGTWSSGWLCNRFHGTKLRDFNSAFKLLDGGLVRSLSLEAKGLNYSTDVTSRVLEHGVAFAEIPVTHSKRLTGTSSMKVVRGAIHRFLFVGMVGYRQLLFKWNVLQRPKYVG